MKEYNTVWNKIYSLLLVLFGVCFAVVEKDITFMIFILIVAVALFFCDENMIGDWIFWVKIRGHFRF